MSWHRSRRREGVARARLGREGTVDLPQSEGDRFWSAVRSLPERQRAMLTLRLDGDLDPTEIAALVGAVVELGRITGVPTPQTDTLYGLARLHGRVRGLY